MDALDQSGKPQVTVDDLQQMVGQEVGISRWHAMSQDVIDRFADVTEDHNFIHVDPERAADTPFGGTIAHGFLTLSMLSIFAYEALPPLKDRSMGINLGFDRVRFSAPVPSGRRIRGRFVLDKVRVRPSGYTEMSYGVTVEIEDMAKPALTAQWKTIAVLEPEGA